MFGYRPYCLDSTGGKTVGFFRESAWIPTSLSRAPLARPCAGVVELADTGDLKSPASQGAYGFDPRLRQYISREDVMADRIGEFLVEIGAMSDSQVVIVINHQKAGDQRLFGEIAMELGYLADNEPIDKFLEYQEKQLGD
jgi:hypothetical protein